jgi:hypothetical protein
MASTDSNTSSSKKRHTFFSNFLSTKHLSVFRTKPSATDNTINISKERKHYRSQININTEQTPIPICIGRGWLKKRVHRPISLDLDLVKNFVTNNDGQPIEQQQQQQFPQTDIGTIMKWLSIYIRKERLDRKELLVTQQKTR